MCHYCVNALNSGNQWAQADGETLHITYTFGATEGHFSANGATNFQTFSAAQQAATEGALAEYAKVANVSFTRVDTANPDNANLVFRAADMPSGIAGWAHYPNVYEGSDITISKNYDGSVMNPGQFGFRLMMHEIGHAMGLQHPHSGSNPLSSSEDSQNASVMSYNSSTSSSVGGYAATRSGPTAPQSLQIYDIATIQYLYGANYDYNSGDTTYSLTGQTKVSTTWDGAGTDTYNSTSYTGGVTLDLREGLQYVTQVGATDLWTAFGANIENAVSGSGNDYLYGNILANTLTSGAGNDYLSGDSGNDSLYGNAGTDIVYGGEGDDLVFGNRDNDSIYGDAGNDTVKGAIGDDAVFGGAGNDLIVGGLGNDTLYGNDGADIFVFARPSGVDVIMDFVKGADVIQITSSIFTTTAQALAATSVSGTNSVVNFGSGDILTISGVTGLGEGDFLIV